MSSQNILTIDNEEQAANVPVSSDRLLERVDKVDNGDKRGEQSINVKNSDVGEMNLEILSEKMTDLPNANRDTAGASKENQSLVNSKSEDTIATEKSAQEAAPGDGAINETKDTHSSPSKKTIKTAGSVKKAEGKSAPGSKLGSQSEPREKAKTLALSRNGKNGHMPDNGNSVESSDTGTPGGNQQASNFALKKAGKGGIAQNSAQPTQESHSGKGALAASSPEGGRPENFTNDQQNGKVETLAFPVSSSDGRTPEASRLHAIKTVEATTVYLRIGRERLEEFFHAPRLALRLIFFLVLVPGFLVLLYLALWASHMYIAESKFALRSQNQSQSLDLLSTFFRSSTSTTTDSYILLNYISSMDMIAKVEEKIDIKGHYSDRSHDIWFRLTKNPTQEELLKYWQWAVKATFDPDTSIMTVEVKAFAPQMAKDISQAVLDASEALVNEMNKRARHDAIAQARDEVTRAEDRVKSAREAMRQYRERTVILDPQAVASGLYGLVNQLEGEITKTTAELAEAMTYMQAESPRIVLLQNRLEILQNQLQAEKARLASQMKGDMPLSAMVSEFQSLTLEEEFAQKQLTSAMAALESARVQAESKTIYVESFQKPLVPDDSLYPKPITFSLIFMMAAAVVLGLVSLIFAAIREHAGF